MLEHFRVFAILFFLGILPNSTFANTAACIPDYAKQFYPLSLGFYQPHEIELPDLVRAAIPSVVEIYVPDEPLPSEGNFRPRSPTVLNHLNQLREKLCREGQTPYCQQKFVNYGRSSGFAFLRDDQLITAHHVIKPLLQLLKLADNFSGEFKIPLVLRYSDDLEGKNLKPVVVSTDLSRALEILEREKKFGWDRFQDFAVLEAPEKIAPALQAGDLSDLHYGAPVFVLGFPGKTSDRTIWDRPDSSGQQFYVSKGQHIDPVNALRSIGVPEVTFCQDASNLRRLENQYLFVSADSYVGNSGGPILDETGKVVGILTGSPPEPQGFAGGGANVDQFKGIAKPQLKFVNH